MDSLSIMEFKVTLVNYINAQELPAEVKRMVLKDIYADVQAQANAEAQEQLNQREAQNNE